MVTPAIMLRWLRWSNQCSQCSSNRTTRFSIFFFLKKLFLFLHRTHFSGSLFSKDYMVNTQAANGQPAVSKRPAYGQYDGQNDVGDTSVTSEALLVGAWGRRERNVVEHCLSAPGQGPGAVMPSSYSRQKAGSKQSSCRQQMHRDDSQIFFFLRKKFIFFVTFALFRVSVPKRLYGQHASSKQQNDGSKPSSCHQRTHRDDSQIFFFLRKKKFFFFFW